MTKSYADACLERAEQTRGSDFISNWVLVEDINELARRLKRACDSLVILKGVLKRKMPVHPEWVQEVIDELEAMTNE